MKLLNLNFSGLRRLTVGYCEKLWLLCLNFNTLSTSSFNHLNNVRCLADSCLADSC